MKKIDWPVVCAFVLFGCMIGLSGQRLDNPLTQVLFAVFIVAFVWLGVGLMVEICRKGRR